MCTWSFQSYSNRHHADGRGLALTAEHDDLEIVSPKPKRADGVQGQAEEWCTDSQVQQCLRKPQKPPAGFVVARDMCVLNSRTGSVDIHNPLCGCDQDLSCCWWQIYRYLFNLYLLLLPSFHRLPPSNTLSLFKRCQWHIQLECTGHTRNCCTTRQDTAVVAAVVRSCHQ